MSDVKALFASSTTSKVRLRSLPFVSTDFFNEKSFVSIICAQITNDILKLIIFMHTGIILKYIIQNVHLHSSQIIHTIDSF